MSDRTNPNRRELLTAATGLAAATVLPAAVVAAEETSAAAQAAKNGRINHSVCLWCYKPMTSAEMAPVAQRLGLKAIDLLTPKEWGPLKEHGLICSMTSGVHGGIETGLDRVENHEPILKTLRELIDASAEAGYPNVICFSGNRHRKRKGKDAPLEGKISDEEGKRNW